MRVIVSQEALEALKQPDQIFKIHALFIFACQGRHVLLFDPIGAADHWIELQEATTASAYARVLQLSMREAARAAADSATVKITTGDCLWVDPVAELDIDSALEVLEQPLAIYCENSKNDWHFLKGILRPSEREQLNERIGRNWATVMHGGGADLVPQLLTRASVCPRRLRTFVLFDSDRRHPDELKDTWTPTPPETCQGHANEIALRPLYANRMWMLRRRFIESYMPEGELKRAANGNWHPQAVSEFLALTPDQRWYYNMKKGFAEDDKVENRHRSKDLYVGLQPDQREALRSGFGRKLADQYVTSDDRELDWDGDALAEGRTALRNLMRLL